MKKLVFLLISLISWVVLADDAARWRDQSNTPRATENGAQTTGGQQELNVTRNIQLNRSGEPPQSAGLGIPAPTFEIDFSQACPGAGNTFTANTGQTLTQRDVPVKVTDGTWPSGTSGSQGNAWSFDGSNDYITSTIGPPAGDFSVMCVVTPSALGATALIIGNYDGASNTRGWQLYQATAAATFMVSDDGTTGAGHYSYVQIANSLAIGRQSVLVASYDYVADGTSIMRLYADELTPAANTSTDGPVYASAYNLSMAAYGAGGSYYAGTMSHCAVWDGTILTPGQARAIIRGAWRGMKSSDGTYVTTTSATPSALMLASPTSGTEPFLIQMPANTSQIANNGTCSGLYGPSAVTSLWYRGLMRSWNGGDGGTGCGDYPTGWSAYCAGGDGTVAVSKDATTKAVDLYSMKMVLTGTTSATYMYSNCRTTEIGQNIKADVYYKCVSGACDSVIILRQYTAAVNCTGAYTDAAAVCSGASWTECISTQTAAGWAGGTQSYRLILSERGNGGVTSNWSAPQLRADAANMPLNIDQFCGTDADANAVCTTTVNYTNSPYSANGPMTTTLTACSPWAGTDITAAQYLIADTAGGAANLHITYVDTTSDEPLYVTYDGAGGIKYISPNVINWAAATPYQIRFGINGSGRMRLWWNSAWNTTTAGAGLGTRTAANANLYLAGFNTGGGNVYTKDIVIHAASPTAVTPEDTWNQSVPR